MSIIFPNSRRRVSDKGMAAIEWDRYAALALGIQFLARARTLRVRLVSDGENVLVFFVDISSPVSKLACAVLSEEVTNCTAGLGLILVHGCLFGSSVAVRHRSW